jgi:gliding motility-associated-like protein
VLNQHEPVTALGCDWVQVTNTSPFSAGQRVLLIQMKGAAVDSSATSAFGSVLDYNSAGRFEFATVASVSAGIITFTRLLANVYQVEGRVQLVTVASHDDARVIGPVSVPPWNGSKGGVIVLEIADSLVLDADISASNAGFDGKFGCANPDGSCGAGPYLDYSYLVSSGLGAEKGEGIANASSTKNGGRGTWANGGGGGNKHNSGGGGGGNFSQGGNGGYQANFCPSIDVGGIGGRALDYSDGRIFFGGGGGSADHNNGVGSSGGNGGGIVIVRCATLVGNGHLIAANGANVPVVVNAIGDGSGGGGAGGTILLDVGAFSGALSLEAKGGYGGDQQTTYPACFGPGGGGGSGIVLLSGPSLPPSTSINTTPGTAGVDLETSSACYLTTYFATPGAAPSTTHLVNFPIAEGSALPAAFSLPNDTVLCEPFSVLLTGPSGVDSLLWSDGSSGSSLLVTSPGTYSIEIFQGACIYRDTVVFIATSPLGNFLGNDTVLCEGASLLLTAPLSTDSIVWSDGSTGLSLTVDSSGTYWAFAFDEGCLTRDTIVIDFLSPTSVFLGPDRNLCEGDTAFLSVPASGLDVLWSTGDTTDTLVVTTPGTYFVQVSNGACTGLDTITLLQDSLSAFSLGNDTAVCDIALVLRSNLVADSYLWSTGDTTDTLAIDEDGTYWLLVTLAGCQRTDSITVTQRSDTASVFIPNVFTPNGDGVMDQYCITADGELLWYELHLYDRNGQLILTTRDPDYCWDGYFNGTPVPDGVYFITLTTNSSCNPDEMVHHGGTVTVLR